MAAPVLFGRRMKRVSGPFGAGLRWDLRIGPFTFAYIEFAQTHHRVFFSCGRSYYESADRKTRANALNWLTAQRDRLVKSLTPEGR
jgi:hypothetical protein